MVEEQLESRNAYLIKVLRNAQYGEEESQEVVRGRELLAIKLSAAMADSSADG
jgi:hypothetical protein